MPFFPMFLLGYKIFPWQRAKKVEQLENLKRYILFVADDDDDEYSRTFSKIAF